jgi:hypothetical protein
MVNTMLIVGPVTSPAMQGNDREAAQLCQRVGELRMRPIKLAKEAIIGPVVFAGQSGLMCIQILYRDWPYKDHHISKFLDIRCFVPITIEIPIAVTILQCNPQETRRTLNMCFESRRQY